ncbi:MAG: hypothetical protein DRN83_02005, partial [Hadesarchaea archaeon]
MQEYFFIAVSTRKNLEICERYTCAGFPNTINGVWAYLDINVGDYLSFLYGAKAYNLYEVVKKEAVKNPHTLPPPWEPLSHVSGKTYHFPFRLHLKLWREFEESLAKPEFMYVAENLLQRGGYRKTHFQADQTTLQNVSQMGQRSESEEYETNMPPYETFTPKFARIKKIDSPEIYPLREVILQSIIRQYLSQPENLRNFLKELGLEKLASRKFEVLGEKALPRGYVDIIIKEAEPVGEIKQIIIEVKLGRASKDDITQLEHYVEEIG